MQFRLNIKIKTLFNLNAFDSNAETWITGGCNCTSKCIRMGHYASLSKKRGDFYLDTNANSPFSMSTDLYNSAKALVVDLNVFLLCNVYIILNRLYYI